MVQRIEIPAFERGVVRVFALSMSDTEAKTLRTSLDPDADAHPLRAVLGAEEIDTNQVEVFPVTDIEEIGLTAYLQQGNGISAEQLTPDRVKLDGLIGWVMIIYSRAFKDVPQDLQISNQLTLIGSYKAPRTSWSEGQPLESLSSTKPTPAKKKPSDAAMSGRIASAALLVLFLVTALMIWIGG